MIKKLFSVCIIMCILAFLLLKPAEALQGSRAGLLLWYRSVLPVLLPIFILSRMLILLDGLSPILKRIHPLIRKIFGLSRRGSYALLLGFFCGYPMGAGVIGSLLREEAISTEEGQYLLRFCNNVSPSFLIGFCITEHLKAPALTLPLLGLIYGTPLLLARFWRHGRIFPELREHPKEKQAPGFQISFKILDTCVAAGLESILKLGCYIILFSIMAKMTAVLPFSHPYLSCLFTGFLEITNGIASVCSLPAAFPMHFLPVIAFVTFGGLCGLAQTKCMLNDTALTTGDYVKAKLITTFFVLTGGIALLYFC